MLIIFGGLPGTGKSTIARELARRLPALYLRIDSIETALYAATAMKGDIGDAGYTIAYALAGDNLALGFTVIADSVNPLTITRDAWRSVAARAGRAALEVEIVCSDQQEHQRRVETRNPDIAGLSLPSWADVLAREYEPWTGSHLVIDSAHASPEACVGAIIAATRA